MILNLKFRGIGGAEIRGAHGGDNRGRAGNAWSSHEWRRGESGKAERVHVAGRGGVGWPHILCSEFEQ